MGMSDYVLQLQEIAADEIDHAARLEERERCARIAERHAEYLRLPIPFSGTVTFRVSQEIAARIRDENSQENT